MRNQLSIAIVAVAIAMTGCRGDSDVVRKDQQNYETVQEGSAAGVTSDLGTAGIPPAAPVTSTNADTTSAFTLQTGTFQPADPRTIGSTLQPSDPSYPPQTAPRPRTPAPPPRIATDNPQPAPTPREDPTPMTSAAPPPPPPPASDTATAEPAEQPEPAPAQEEPKKEEPEEQQEEPAPAPPPPPSGNGVA